MAIRHFKPTSAGRRWFEVPDFAGLSNEILDHSDVQHVASRSDVVGRLSRLVQEFLADV